MRRSPVVPLLFPCCPSAIRRLVITVVVYAVDAMQCRGFAAHVSEEILESVPCDENLPEVVAKVIESYRFEKEAREHAALSDPLFAAAGTAGLASRHSPRRVVSPVVSPVRAN